MTYSTSGNQHHKKGSDICIPSPFSPVCYSFHQADVPLHVVCQLWIFSLISTCGTHNESEDAKKKNDLKHVLGCECHWAFICPDWVLHWVFCCILTTLSLLTRDGLLPDRDRWMICQWQCHTEHNWPLPIIICLGQCQLSFWSCMEWCTATLCTSSIGSLLCTRVSTGGLPFLLLKT